MGKKSEVANKEEQVEKIWERFHAYAVSEECKALCAEKLRALIIFSIDPKNPLFEQAYSGNEIEQIENCLMMIELTREFFSHADPGQGQEYIYTFLSNILGDRFQVTEACGVLLQWMNRQSSLGLLTAAESIQSLALTLQSDQVNPYKSEILIADRIING